MTPKGGARAGAGRKPGSKNSKTAEIARKAAAGGITPLEYMLKIMRNPKASVARRDEMAKAAASFVHPRLAAVEMSGGLTVTHEAALDALK